MHKSGVQVSVPAKMLTIEIDDSAAVVHCQLAILSELLKFNIAVAEDFTITDSELLHLLNRHRLRESIKAVDTIFSAFTEHSSRESGEF